MSPTQPHVHGKCAGGLHSLGLHHLSSHPYSHSWLGLHSDTHVHGCRAAQRTTQKVRDPPLESAERARCGYLNGEVQRGQRYAAGSAFLIIPNRGSIIFLSPDFILQTNTGTSWPGTHRARLENRWPAVWVFSPCVSHNSHMVSHLYSTV